MTTAARPTFLPAMGGFSLRDNNTLASKVRNNLDLKSEFTIKYRQKGQNSLLEVKEKDFLGELKEKESLLGKRFLELEGDDLRKRSTFLKEISDLDQDDSSLDSEEEDEEEEDETEALMRELQAIKEERKAQELAKEEEELSQKQEEALQGNPLLMSGNFQIKKRWDDDVIFKNQAVEVEKPKKRFINDLLRSDFHRKFMSKYIK
jgi:protein CWC15